MKTLTYGKQNLDKTDAQAVLKVLEADWITQGPTIEAFEKAMASFCGAKYAVAVSNGTDALHLACIVAGLSKGDEMITTPITFMGTANAALYVGAKPVFADINYETANIDVNSLKKRINKKTRVLLPVDFSGLPCDMMEIKKVAKEKGLVVIEDGCHALGAQYRNKPVGSCQYADMTIFSFHPVKHITTGEGGCIVTNNKKYYERLRALRHHGVYKTSEMGKRVGGWYMEMRELGFNCRITDLQCALGLSQLKRLKKFNSRRQEIAKLYDKGLKDLTSIFRLPQIKYEDRTHVWHLYLLRLRNQKRITRRKLYDQLKNAGILCQVHYKPVYQEPYYKKTLKVNARCPNAEKYYSETISLPMHPGLTNADVKRVIKTLREIVGA